MVNQSCAARLALAPLSRALVFQPRSIRIDFIKASFFLCYALTTATGGSSDVRRFRRLISIAPGRDRKHSLTQSAPAHGTLAAHSRRTRTHTHARAHGRHDVCLREARATKAPQVKSNGSRNQTRALGYIAAVPCFCLASGGEREATGTGREPASH